MLHKWIEVLKTTDVEPGETIYEGSDPDSDTRKEIIVKSVSETMIELTDGSTILESRLSSGKYWHKFKQSPL